MPPRLADADGAAGAYAECGFTDAQVRSVTVWKIESDYFTTKVRTKPAPAHMHQR